MLTLAGNPSRDPGRREGHFGRLASSARSTLMPGGRRADVVGVGAPVGGADPRRDLWRRSKAVLPGGGGRSDFASSCTSGGRARWGSPEILPEAKKNASVRILTASPPASGLHSCPHAASPAAADPPCSLYLPAQLQRRLFPHPQHTSYSLELVFRCFTLLSFQPPVISILCQALVYETSRNLQSFTCFPALLKAPQHLPPCRCRYSKSSRGCDSRPKWKTCVVSGRPGV